MAISFKSIQEGPTGNNLLLVDSMNLAFRWKHQGKTQFKEEYLRTVQSLAKSYNCSKVIIAADMGGSSFRYEIYPEYKQDRKEKAALQTPEEKEAFNLFFQEFERTLEFLNEYPVLRYKGVEADDIAAYLVKKVKDYKIDHIWLISSDKDWDLLITDVSSRWSYVTRKEITLSNWPYNVSPEDYISYKALIGGDDNINGIPSIGPVRAAELIKQYGSALDIYDRCPLPGKYKYIQSLNENKELILRNLHLMDLLSFCEDAIGPQNLEHINSVVTGYLNGSD